MPTYAEIVQKLEKPIPVEEISFRVIKKSNKGDKGLIVGYVDSRDVQIHLDRASEYLWEDRYEFLGMHNVRTMGNNMNAAVVRCQLTLHGSDHSITKEGYGQGSDVKAAESDAIKRAAVKHTLGRGLYELDLGYFPIDNYGQITPASMKQIRQKAAKILNGEINPRDMPKTSEDDPAPEKPAAQKKNAAPAKAAPQKTQAAPAKPKPQTTTTKKVTPETQLIGEITAMVKEDENIALADLKSMVNSPVFGNASNANELDEDQLQLLKLMVASHPADKIQGKKVPFAPISEGTKERLIELLHEGGLDNPEEQEKYLTAQAERKIADVAQLIELEGRQLIYNMAEES